jgi:hypothetical protein
MPSGNIEAYINAASLIDADGSAPWLPEHLRSWAPSLFLDRWVAEKQPTRRQMRLILQRVEDAATLLGRALGSAPVREFLEGPPYGPFPNLGHLTHDLSDLADRAARANDSEALATKSGVTRPGRGKAMPAGAISPMTYCALLVSETWNHLHGAEPLPKNQKALAAAEALWRAAGGDARPLGEEPLARWRHHFRLAHKADQKRLRAEYRRHLVEGERSWNWLHGSADRAA